MHPNGAKNQRGNKKDVKGIKSAESCAPDGVAGEDELRQSLAHERHTPRLLCGNIHRPEGDLIPAQELPGKTHSYDQQK